MLKNFRTYHLALELYEACSEIKAKYFLKDQLQRASLSVVLNIAEGSAKTSTKERRRFYEIAFASTREVQSLLQILKKPAPLKIADQVAACLYTLTRKQ